MRSRLGWPQTQHPIIISCVALSTSVHCSIYEPLWVVTVVYKINPTTHCFFSPYPQATLQSRLVHLLDMICSESIEERSNEKFFSRLLQVGILIVESKLLRYKLEVVKFISCCCYRLLMSVSGADLHRSVLDIFNDVVTFTSI